MTEQTQKPYEFRRIIAMRTNVNVNNRHYLKQSNCAKESLTRELRPQTWFFSDDERFKSDDYWAVWGQNKLEYVLIICPAKLSFAIIKADGRIILGKETTEITMDEGARKLHGTCCLDLGEHSTKTNHRVRDADEGSYHYCVLSKGDLIVSVAPRDGLVTIDNSFYIVDHNFWITVKEPYNFRKLTEAQLDALDKLGAKFSNPGRFFRVGTRRSDSPTIKLIEEIDDIFEKEKAKKLLEDVPEEQRTNLRSSQFGSILFRSDRILGKLDAGASMQFDPRLSRTYMFGDRFRELIESSGRELKSIEVLSRPDYTQEDPRADQKVILTVYYIDGVDAIFIYNPNIVLPPTKQIPHQRRRVIESIESEMFRLITEKTALSGVTYVPTWVPETTEEPIRLIDMSEISHRFFDEEGNFNPSDQIFTPENVLDDLRCLGISADLERDRALIDQVMLDRKGIVEDTNEDLNRLASDRAVSLVLCQWFDVLDDTTLTIANDQELADREICQRKIHHRSKMGLFK